MDVSFKQRLIGASVLVALAVIFLPMLIGGPRQESNRENISTEIPGYEGRTVERRSTSLVSLPKLNDNTSATAETASQPSSTVEDEDRVVTVDNSGAPPRVDAVSGLPVGTSAPSEVPAEALAEEKPVTPMPVPRNVTTPTPPPPRPVVTPPAPATPVAPPPAVAMPAPAQASAVPAATASGRWAVNLGSYANAANANALVSQLRNRNLPAYSEATTHNGKPVQRVRVGPFAQRSEAESARLSIQTVRSDVPTAVVSLEGEKAPPAVAPSVASGFAVQIGALRAQSDANTLRDRARAAGFSSYVEQINTSNGVLWRVRVGPEVQRASAERVKAELKTKLGIDGNVVTHP